MLDRVLNMPLSSPNPGWDCNSRLDSCSKGSSQNFTSNIKQIKRID